MAAACRRALPLLPLLLLLLAARAASWAASPAEEAEEEAAEEEEEAVPAEWTLLRVVRGRVGAGNYTHVRLEHAGRLVLRLRSLRGDADLYVAAAGPPPSFDDYELRAASCGPDELRVPARLARPLGVGVYGHPAHRESRFVMKVYRDRGRGGGGGAEEEDGEDEEAHGPGGERHGEDGAEDEDGDEPLLWTVLLGVGKLLLDVLV